jgi:hypothetical protein
MAVTIYDEGSQACSAATEHQLTNSAAETTAGVYQLRIDGNPLSGGVTLRMRIYEELRSSSGTQRLMLDETIVGPLGAEKIWTCPPLPLINGWKMTIESSGTPTIEWDILKVG